MSAMSILSLAASCVWVQRATSAECINPFEWPCPRYRTGYGVDITTRILALFELVTGEMNLESLMFVTFLLHSLSHYLST
jgi:hypothetical protein